MPHGSRTRAWPRLRELLTTGRQAYSALRLIVRRLDRLVALLERLAEQQSPLEGNAAHEAEFTRLAATQALLARLYERDFNWNAHIEAVRNEDGYESAWDGEPLITVRIATYNKADVLVERALASVLRQTYPHWEAIVVGDCCTDDTAGRIAEIGDPRIKFENLPVRGPYPPDTTSLWHTAGLYPMNRGLELARGAWVAALDDDDEWDDDHLEVLLAEAKRSRAEIVYGQFRMVDAETKRTFDHPFGANYPPMDGAIGFQTALCHGKLSRFRFDPNCYLAGEPGDRNLARRLYEAGVRFSALRRPVVTYWFEPRTLWGHTHLQNLRKQYGYADNGEVSERVEHRSVGPLR